LLSLSSCGSSPPWLETEASVQVDGAGVVALDDSLGKESRSGWGDSFVDRHGMLSVKNGKIVDVHHLPVQLKGMSLFWSQWSAGFWNDAAVASIAQDWRASVVRAAMGVEEDGYLANPGLEKAKVRTIVNAAMAQGIYVIIDWHDHNATQHTQQAVEFFGEMAGLYANNPHVIFEIFNEPLDISWGEVKSYAETVIRAIRAKGARNLVIVGSPSWSQRVDMPANDPIRDGNVAYSLHFYATTHRQELRNAASYALSRGIALFVTEFGVCEASGNGPIDYGESNQWFDFMKRHQIGWANWSLNDKDESASALLPGASPNGGWTDADLSNSGRFIRSKMRE
jgi:endoglucanase